MPQGPQLFAFTLYQDKPFSIEVRVGSQTQVFLFQLNDLMTPSSGRALEDYGHTFTWDGITSVTVNGQSVDPSLLTMSGNDGTLNWALPEPLSLAMLAIGSTVFLRRHR